MLNSFSPLFGNWNTNKLMIRVVSSVNSLISNQQEVLHYTMLTRLKKGQFAFFSNTISTENL